MLKEFLSGGISAAGLSHTVTSKSVLRRFLWVCVLIGITLTMMYFTYNVLQEYLKYPVIMQTKITSTKVMEFPAVTVCSYSLIARHNAKEANSQYLVEMEEILDSLSNYQANHTKKNICLNDPLCIWSRLLEKCFCFPVPCFTFECHPFDNNTSCSCSKSFCTEKDKAYNCSMTEDEPEGKTCLCRNNLKNFGFGVAPSSITPNFLEAVSNLNASSRVKELLVNIKNSTSATLKQTEQFYRPNITLRENYGISFDDLVISCTFDSRPCDRRQIVTLYSPGYGKCYMFNYAGIEAIQTQAKTIKHPGQTHGLQLYLKNERPDTLPIFSSQQGVRVIIHDPRTLPFASQMGFDIRTEDMTSVILRYREITRLGPPWGYCAYDGDNRTSNYLAIPYSKLGCLRKCFNDYVFKLCNCYHVKYMSGKVIPFRRHVCQKINENCAQGAFNDIYNDKVQCSCPPKCREKQYDESISAGRVNEDFFRIIKLARSLKMVNGVPAVTHPDLDRLGLMGLQVYFGSFCVTNITETSIYSWEFLVSNIGGNLGLFLGLSLVTFVEIAEFIFDILVQTCYRRKCSWK